MSWMRAILPLLLCANFAFSQSDNLNGRIRRLLPSPQREQALAALDVHDYNRLQQIVTTVPLTEAVPAQTLALNGAVAFLNSNMLAAAQYFGGANALAPLAETDAFTWAMAVIKLANDEAGRQILSKLKAAHPSNALYIYWLGKIDYYERRYDDAVVKLQEALRLDPSSPRAWDSLGLAYDMQGRMDEAQEALEKAVTLNRTLSHPSPWPPHDLGYLLLRIGRSADAEANLRESLRYEPTLFDAQYHLGRALEKQGRDEQAIEEYKLAVAANSSATDACYSLAMHYRKMNRTKEGAEMFAEYKRRKQLESGAMKVEIAK